jgi:two-component system, OmpR family, sensor kinase
MYSKNKIRTRSSIFQAAAPDQKKHHSLRLRLMLWYGILLAIALVFFAALVLLLTMDAIDKIVESGVRTESLFALVSIRRELRSTPPYWPPQLSLNAIDTYHAPGLIIQVMDLQGNILYHSQGGTSIRIPLDENVAQATDIGQTSWYTTTVNGSRLRVEALPILTPPKDTTARANTGPVIGRLLVAKSLDDVDETFLLLRILLLLVGGAALVGALIGSWAIMTNVFRPLTDIVKTSRDIAAATARGTRIGNLSQRVMRPEGRNEMVQVVDTFNEMLTDLEHAVQAQRRFVADASHELRAPLTTIQGNLAFLRRHLDEIPTEERRTMLSDAHQETLRLTQLVEELLLLARVDASIDTPLPMSETQMRLEKQIRQEIPVELDHAVLQLVRQLRRRLSAEESAIKLEVGHIEAVRVYGDEEALRRVTLILLDNALKYTAPDSGEGSGQVTVSLERLEKQAVLCVRDTGIGIDPADLPHIFERFYRADRARSRQGTGLGLSIALTLVEQHGGHITAESTPGQGSTFSVWLPLA